MLWCFSAVTILTRIRVNVTAYKTTAVGISIIRISVEIFTAKCDRISFHITIGTVSRVTTLTTTITTFSITEGNITTGAHTTMVEMYSRTFRT